MLKEFQGAKEKKGISSGNKRKYTEIKETDTKLGKNATIIMQGKKWKS
jgi:uncharacterized protein YaaR (DUF327 family)